MERNIHNKCNQLFEVIFKTTFGTIYRSGLNKNMYTIEFGNMFLSLTHDNIDRFEKFVSETNDDELNNLMIPSIQKVVIQPMKSLGSYAFTKCEFLKLRELLNGAKSIVMIEQDLAEILNIGNE